MGEPIPEPLPRQPPTPASRRFVVLMAIATAVVVIAALVGFDVWRSNQPDASDLANKVLNSMNQSLDADQQYHKVGLHVKSITIVHVVGDMFEGQATVATKAGTDHQVSVHVDYDGDTLLWHTDPGSFAFTVQEQFEGTS